MSKESKRRKALESVIDEFMQTLIDDLQAIDPEKRVKLFAQLLPYVLPKLTEIKQEMEVKTEGDKITVEIVGSNNKEYKLW